MKPKNLYLGLCVAGTVIPYAAFLPWVAAHGLNLRLFVEQLLANRISVFFGLDVIVSAVVLVVFAAVERGRMRLYFSWTVLPALLCVGVSLALPLLLYQREVGLERFRSSET